MEQAQKFQRLPVIVKLPKGLSVEIGKIMVRWANIEWRLHQIGYRLLDVSPAVGRIAMCEPRATDYLDMICDLLDLSGLSIPAQVPILRAEIEKWGKWRNRLAHGIWVRHPKTREYMVQASTGQWDRSKLPRGQRLSREILTEAVTITEPILKDVVRASESIGAQLEAFWRGVDKALPQPLPDKSRGPSRTPDRRLDHIAQKLTHPPRPSRG